MLPIVMSRCTTLVLLAIAGGERQVLPTEGFQVVSGSGYEGAIIPSSLVPDWYKGTGVTSTWTPTAADVGLTESRLVSYLGTAAKDPSRASPPIEFGFDHPPHTVKELVMSRQVVEFESRLFLSS
jgi:hypothetical protein